MMLVNRLLHLPSTIWQNRFLLLNRYRFKNVGKGARIYNPLRIDGISRISIGDHTIVSEGTWLAAMPLTGKDAQLVISDGVCLGHFNHIYATGSIVIENNVLTADKVYISDNLHSYEDVNLPVIQQPIKQCKPVVIGEGSWLGENVCVIGASIGKHCVIGANAVVTKDIPDYSVAVGAPARVIKKYNVIEKSWAIPSELGGARFFSLCA